MKDNNEISNEDGICFTIMPFGGWFDTYYSEVYAPAIKESGLTPRRADDVYRPGTIVHDIWNLTKASKIIVADLTGKNPNVLYELGLAHALTKPVILLTESLEDIPFDLRALRIIEYDKNNPEWGNILKKKIKDAIQEVTTAPLKSVLPAFLEVDESKPSKKISSQEKDILEIRHELDTLRRNVVTQQVNPPESLEDIKDDPIWEVTIKSLGLPTRTLNILLAEDIYFIGQLVQKSEVDLLQIQKLGRNSLIDIKDSLATRGLALGMNYSFLKTRNWH
ncbi:MAG: DNA-directed RNA polymerase subunit alpha C-terminal domain-containing protein [Candidatus Sedimenticola sp. (ex Thyasira tokunagai)]